MNRPPEGRFSGQSLKKTNTGRIGTNNAVLRPAPYLFPPQRCLGTMVLVAAIIGFLIALYAVARGAN
jgi:hypothetical protein